MRAVQIAIVIVFEILVCLGLAVLINNRVIWTSQVNDLSRQGMSYDDLEKQTEPDNLIKTSSPVMIELSSGDLGLTITVLFLSLLFTSSLAFARSLPNGFKVYTSIFLLVVLATEGVLVIQQQLVLSKAHRIYLQYGATHGGAPGGAPIYTTEHGARIRIAKVNLNATVRDPNIIPLLMISAFFVPWFVLQKKSQIRRSSSARANSTTAK